MYRTSYQSTSSEFYPPIHSVFLPDDIDLSSATLPDHAKAQTQAIALEEENKLRRDSIPNSKRPSISPRRESLPPPPGPKSATSRKSFQSTRSNAVIYVEDQVPDGPSTLNPYGGSKEGENGFAADPDDFSVGFSTSKEYHSAGTSIQGEKDEEGLFEILKEEESNRLRTISSIADDSEGSAPCPRTNSRFRRNHLSLDFLKNINTNSQCPTNNSDQYSNRPSFQDNNQECDLIPKTPRTPKQFIQDHFEIKTPKLPLPLPFSSQHHHDPHQRAQLSIPIPIPVPTHINLPRPIMPIIHIFLIIAHLILSGMIPYLLFKNFIQPLVLWIITTVTVVLQCVYLLPGITLEVIGLFRRRPVDSAWLQSGLHLVIMILSLIPHGATLFLLIVGNQVPECPSAFIYKPPDLPNFESHVRWSACEQLPKVTMIATVNLIIVTIEIIVTSVSVSVDYRIQRKEERRHSKVLLDKIVRNESSSLQGKTKKKKDRRKTWWREKDDPQVEAYKKIRKRRWTTGTGKLLWDIEGYIHRKKAQKYEQKTV